MSTVRGALTGHTGAFKAIRGRLPTKLATLILQTIHKRETSLRDAAFCSAVASRATKSPPIDPILLPFPVARCDSGNRITADEKCQRIKKKADSARYDIAMLRMFQNITMILKQNSDNDVFNNCSLKKKCNYFIKKN